LDLFNISSCHVEPNYREPRNLDASEVDVYTHADGFGSSYGRANREGARQTLD